MDRVCFFAFIFVFNVTLAHSQQCLNIFSKSQSEEFVDDWVGFKCDPLDTFALQQNGFNSPCDCLKKEKKSTRIKDALLENRIQDLLEKKVAEVIRTQIDYGFEQSLRLDTILKQGGLDIDHSAIKEAFPVNCRAGKIGETIAEAAILPKTLCNKSTYEKRLKVFLNGKKDFNEYLNSKMNTFESATMNRVSEDDKKRGICVPYKTFQSLSNVSPFRKSYLSLAKYFRNKLECPSEMSYRACDELTKTTAFKRFQDWASDRSDPSDVFTLIGIDERRNTPLPFRASVPGEVGGFGKIRGMGLVNPGFGIVGGVNLELNNVNQIEKIDRVAIVDLIKTDPIFERMLKDPDFFSEIAIGSYGTPGAVKESPEVVSAIMKSQDKQCKELYGAANPSSMNKVNTNSRNSGKNQDGNAKVDNVDKSQNEKNLLTQFLCDEEFPKKFLNNDTVRNVLAPELKESAKIDGIKHAEAIMAKWAYCSDDKIKESAEGSFEIVFGLEPKNENGTSQPLANFLNLSLNPKSDLDSSADNKDNKYEKFNKTICGFVEEKCKKIDPNNKTVDCSTSNIAKTATQKMLSTLLDTNELLEVQARIDDQKSTDKAVKFSLKMTGKLTNDQINTLIFLRNQTVESKNERAILDLKSALGISEDTDIDTYFNEHGGREEVLKKSIIPYDVKRRLKDGRRGFVSDNVYAEKTTNNNSSYFSNYYALAEAADEKIVSSYNKDPVKQDGRVGDGSVIVGTDPVGEIKDPAKEGPLSQVVAPMYQRKNFASVSSDPIKPITKPEVPESKDKPLEDKKEQIAQAPEVNEDEILENNSKKDRTETVNNSSKDIKKFSNLILSKNSNSSDSRMEKENLDKSRERNNERDELEKIKKDLEDKLDRKRTQLENLENNSDSNSGGNGLSEHNEQKNKLMDEIRKLKEDNRANRSNRGIANNNNIFNNRSPDIDDFGGDSLNNPFNNGYRRGEEFDKERMKDKLDDGSSEFDPEQGSKKDKVSDDKSQRGGSGGSEGAGGGKGKGGSPALSKSGGGGDDFEGEGSGGANGKRKRRRGGSGSADDVVTKCGTGPILKCIFPNSYFVDEKIKDRLYTTIHNLKLEGRMFQGLHKARKSKKDMRMGDSNNVKYYLYTYDLVTTEPIFDRQPAGGPKGQNKNVRQITNDERDVIFKEIKENRGNPLFKKKLFKYERMTQAVPPRRLLNEKEASEAVKRSITQEEYEALQE